MMTASARPRTASRSVASLSSELVEAESSDCRSFSLDRHLVPECLSLSLSRKDVVFEN